QDRSCPLIVASTLILVPRSGIARAVVNQIERRIVGDPSPHRATASFPGVTRPSRHAEVCPTIVGVKRLELWADLHILVGPNVVGSPDFLAGRCIERRDPAAYAHLAAART